MFAVIETGGKQYKVTKGSQIWVEKIDQEPESEITFPKVLLVSSEGETQLGSGAKATVTGKILRQGRRKKILVFKQIRRKRYRRIKGHRQYYTAVEITDISSKE